MNADELKQFDSSFEVVNTKDELKDIEGLTTVSKPKAAHVLFVKDKKFLKKLLNNLADKPCSPLGLIVQKSLWGQQDCDWDNVCSQMSFVATVENVDLAMSRLSKPFYNQKYNDLDLVTDGRELGTAKVSSTAQIAKDVFIGDKVSIGENVKIYPGCVIMAGSNIGDNTEIFPNVTIYSFVEIGSNCRIHAGTVLGADGFGYNFFAGKHEKVWQMGGVIIEDDVEIGANSAVDSGTFSPTFVGRGSKIDNQVQIGHNCELGTGVIMCGQAASAGSTIIGDYTVMGGGAGLGPGITLGKGCQVGGMAGVTGNLDDGSMVAGIPARPVKEWLRGIAFLRKNSK